MKLVVFAHTPPPHHGQSYMVKLMIDGFGGDRRDSRDRESSERLSNPYGIECYHVNARLSRDLEDVGSTRFGKLLPLLKYCCEAIWCRYRYGAATLYYVPAPGKRSALMRDWIVMGICRLFFKKIVFHWHAAGLAEWLEKEASWLARALTKRAYRGVDLSIVLAESNRRDAETLTPNQIRVVPNGIPDPCPDFATAVLPRRRARALARDRLLSGEMPTAEEAQKAGGDPHIFKVLFLGHCTRVKGLFDTMDAVELANSELEERRCPIRVQLTVAGGFMQAQEQAEFEARLASQKEVALPAPVVAAQIGGDAGIPSPSGAETRFLQFKYIGFVSGEAKSDALREADCLCFPTYYEAESFGLVIVEAMAYGVSIVASNWRSIPEILPPQYTGLVEPRQPQQLAEKIIRSLAVNDAELLRARFLERFTLEQYLKGLADAIRSI